MPVDNENISRFIPGAEGTITANIPTVPATKPTKRRRRKKAVPVYPVVSKPNEWAASSPALSAFYDAMQYGSKIDMLPAKRNPLRSAQYNVDVSGDQHESRTLRVKNNKNEFEIRIPDIGLLERSNGAVLKTFQYILQQVNKQSFHNGTLTKSDIVFPLQDLVDLGFFKNTKNAKEGFKTAIKTLKGIMFSGYSEKAKGKRYEVIGFSPIVDAVIDSGMCIVFLSDPEREVNGKKYSLFNWQFLIQYFFPLPQYFYALSDRGCSLLGFIMSQARQNSKTVKAKKSINISFSSIGAKLALPDAKDSRNPGRDTVGSIGKAVEDIENRQRESHISDLMIELHCDPDASYTAQMEQGYLTVSFQGDLWDMLANQATKAEKVIDQHNKRKEKIVDDAKAKALQKKMESESKN